MRSRYGNQSTVPRQCFDVSMQKVRLCRSAPESQKSCTRPLHLFCSPSTKPQIPFCTGPRNWCSRSQLHVSHQQGSLQEQVSRKSKLSQSNLHKEKYIPCGAESQFIPSISEVGIWVSLYCDTPAIAVASQHTETASAGPTCGSRSWLTKHYHSGVSQVSTFSWP